MLAEGVILQKFAYTYYCDNTKQKVKKYKYLYLVGLLLWVTSREIPFCHRGVMLGVAHEGLVEVEWS